MSRPDVIFVILGFLLSSIGLNVDWGQDQLQVQATHGKSSLDMKLEQCDPVIHVKKGLGLPSQGSIYGQVRIVLAEGIDLDDETSKRILEEGWVFASENCPSKLVDAGIVDRSVNIYV